MCIYGFLSFIFYYLKFGGIGGEKVIFLIQSIFIDHQQCIQNCSELFRNTKEAVGSVGLVIRYNPLTL